MNQARDNHPEVEEFYLSNVEIEAEIQRLEAGRGRLSRRDFLKTAAVVAAGAGVVAVGAQGLTGTVPQAAAANLPPGKVATVFGEASVAEGKINAEIAAKMVNLAVMRLQGKPDAAAAWKDLFSAKDVVGLKLNSQAGPLLSTSRAVIDALIRALVGIGVPENNIIVWDNAKRDRAGYQHNTGPEGVRSYNGNEPGFEPMVDLPLGGKTALSKLFTRDTTATINVPVLKDHGITGLTFALKNLALGITSNPGALHRSIHNSIAGVCALPEVRQRVRLHLGDALLGLWAGGPSAKPAGMWACKTVVASHDPVAMDTWAADTISAERRRRSPKSPPLKAPQLEAAAKLGVGSASYQLVEDRV